LRKFFLNVIRIENAFKVHPLALESQALVDHVRDVTEVGLPLLHASANLRPVNIAHHGLDSHLVANERRPSPAYEGLSAGCAGFKYEGGSHNKGAIQSPRLWSFTLESQSSLAIIKKGLQGQSSSSLISIGGEQ